MIVGLGNPGRQYEETRHNIGFLLIDAFAKANGLPPWTTEKRFDAALTLWKRPGSSLYCVKPQRYMNLSGEVLANVCRYFKIAPEEVLLLHDDITLALGEVKVSQKAGPGGHNGVADIEKHIGPGCTRYRIGVGAKKHPAMTLSDHVLSTFSNEEKTFLEARLETFLKDLQILLEKELDKATNIIHS
ncbi:MAG: aminoacyl-tRNA hydrolase [Verrucomicrobia bacterium GWF2_51_19]|nr:MAG: aminoacyl-tRNA hydrolase [Verrucomicrobia bacterium GWF2_51_19]